MYRWNHCSLWRTVVVLMWIVCVYCIACDSATYDGRPLRRCRIPTQSCSVTLCSAACLWWSVSWCCCFCLTYDVLISYLFAFSALTLLVGQQEGHPAFKKTDWWDAGVVMCLGQDADLHMAQLMPLPLTIPCSSKSRLVLPSWWYLSGVGLPR